MAFFNSLLPEAVCCCLQTCSVHSVILKACVVVVVVVVPVEERDPLSSSYHLPINQSDNSVRVT